MLAAASTCLLGYAVASAHHGRRPVSRTAGRIPAVVDPAADLAAQTPGPQVTWVDSIFVTGRQRGGGHDFGILVHTLDFPNAGERRLFIAVIDTTTGWYRNFQAGIPRNGYIWSHRRLQIQMPGLTWTGSARRMEIRARTPWGSLQACFTPDGPVMNYSGVGVANLLGDVDFEYAFPSMRTTGTPTAEGATRRVRGVSWLDRQWGPLPLTDPSMRWTWMNITLAGGDQLAVWDIRSDRAQSCWVTVLRPDGSYELAAVRPLTDGAGRFWTSPATGKTYPTRWRIVIPSLRARLSVAVTRPRGQEFPDGHVEAAATVAGTYRGKPVTGTTYVEMTGDWNRPPGRRS